MTIAQLPIHIMLITPIAVALFVLGILVAAGKADRWIAGYNTASEEERAKVNIKRVRWISAMMPALFHRWKCSWTELFDP